MPSSSDRAPGPQPIGELVAFFALACALSWLDWGLVLASQRGALPFHVPLNPWGSFGPALAALLVVAWRAGRAGLRALLAPLARWRFGAVRWLAVLFGPALLVALAVALHALAGGRVLPAQPLDVGELLLLAVLLLVVGGPLGEEIGWRGFALPALLARTGPAVASLILAGMWAIWHLPLFWLPGATQEGGSFVLFVTLVAAFSILTTWLYLATGRSLLAALFFHHAINLSTYLLPSLFPALESAPRFDRIFAGVAWLAAAIAWVALSRRPQGDSPHAET